MQRLGKSLGEMPVMERELKENSFRLPPLSRVLEMQFRMLLFKLKEEELFIGSDTIFVDLMEDFFT